MTLTKDGSVKPRVHVDAATKKMFICGLDRSFVREALAAASSSRYAGLDTMPPDEGNAYIFKAIGDNMLERCLMENKLVRFPGRYEKPRHCFSVELHFK